MQHLSRRFSGFVFLYIAIGGLLIHAFIILALLFPEIGMQAPDIPIKLLRYLIVFLPPLIFIGVRRYPFLKLIRVNTFSVKSLWFTLGISVCLYLFVHMLDLLISGLISTALMPEYPIQYFSNNYRTIWPLIITSCLIPALFEVMIFQGVIQSGFKDLKPLRSSLYTGLLFALFMHIGSLFFNFLSLVDLIPLFIMGFVISYVSIKTNSVFPGMITAFLFYLLINTGIADWFYINCLMPLGISENLAIFVIALLSVIIGGILLVRMPQADNSRTLKIPSVRKLIKKLLHSREKFQRSWLWKEENESVQPAEKEQVSVDKQEFDERLVYPDDSEKQRKGAGFKIGVILIASAVLGDLGLSIYFIITNGF